MVSINPASLFPKTPMDLIASQVLSEVEKGLKNGSIKPEQLEVSKPLDSPAFSSNKSISEISKKQLIYRGSGQETIDKMIAVLKTRSLSLSIRMRDHVRTITIHDSSELSKEAVEKILAEEECYTAWRPKVLDEVDESGNRLVILIPISEKPLGVENSRKVSKISPDMRKKMALFCSALSMFAINELAALSTGRDQIISSAKLSQVSRVSSGKQLNGEEIAETLQAEASFTIATDKKPILATYGCGPCVALGGYDATNKIAFIVHFSNAREVRESGSLIFYNITKLVKKEIATPIQLHLRGGIEGRSEPIVEAIKNWMKQKKDLPMEIASEEILLRDMGNSKSLSIDSRTGEVSEYNPLDNPKSRSDLDVRASLMRALSSPYNPEIHLAYSPK